MKIAVEGCAHGELEQIYDTIQGIEKAENIKVSLLLCCGDFQATRNLDDLQTMAVPQKYQDICTFYKYYSGEKVAPILTIFIGGNHEASNYLQELPYGGWVAPNIYYLGFAGVVVVNGIRIAGISGIYKGHDFLKGHHEFSPYSESTKKSVYHIRQLEVFRLKQLSGKIDIFMSHDWPRGIYNFGNKAQLLRFKPHFRDDIEQNQLGNRPCEELLHTLKPQYWFAAHLHCKFSALVVHETPCKDESNERDNFKPQNELENISERITKFLALDKCLPKRRFLQLLDIDSTENIDEGEIKFEYDAEWLAILFLTNHLINVKNTNTYMPGHKGSINNERSNFTPTIEEIEHVRRKFDGDLRIPKNFCRTVEPYNPNGMLTNPQQPKAQIHPHSLNFCDTLGIDDPLSLAMLINGYELNHSSTLESSDINDSSLMFDEQASFDSSIGCNNSSLNSQQASPVKRKSNLGIVLPQPTTSSVKTDREGLEENSECLQIDDCIHTGTVDKNSVETPAQDLNVDVNSKPPNKKFKRRNQDIYKDDDDEE